MPREFREINFKANNSRLQLVRAGDQPAKCLSIGQVATRENALSSSHGHNIHVERDAAATEPSGWTIGTQGPAQGNKKLERMVLRS